MNEIKNKSHIHTSKRGLKIDKVLVDEVDIVLADPQFGWSL